MNADQKKLLSLMKEVNEICVQNDIIYYLAGGSLIGALRHDGFIPWDDDLDILMTKSNWDKFVEVARRGGLPEGRSLQCQMLDRDYPNVVGRYTDMTTTTIHANEMLGYGAPGYVIDVLIMDPLPGRGPEYEKYTEDLLLYSDLINPLAIYSYRYITNQERYKEYSDRIKIEGKEKVIGELEQELARFKEEDCDYYALRWGGVPLLSEKKIYGTGAPRWVDFEDGRFMAPERAADYLTWHYGDEWMQVPASVEQVTHDAVFSLSIDYKTILNDYLPEIDVKKEYEYFQEKKEEIMGIADQRQEKKYLDIKVSGEVVRQDTLGRIKRFEEERQQDLASALAGLQYEELNNLFENYKFHQFSRRFSGREDYGGITRFLKPVFIDIGMANLEILASVLIHTNQVSRAVRLFEIIEQCSKEELTEGIRKQKQLIQQIRGLYSSYDLEDHAQTLDKCRTLFEKDSYIDSVSMLFIKLLIEKKEYDEAREVIGKMKEVFPGNKIYDKYLADLVYEKGDHWAAYQAYSRDIDRINDGLVRLDIQHKIQQDQEEIQALLQGGLNQEAVRTFFKLDPTNVDLINGEYLLRIEEMNDPEREERLQLLRELWDYKREYENDRRLCPAFIAYYMKFDNNSWRKAENRTILNFADNYQDLEEELQRLEKLPAETDPVEKLLLLGEVKRRMGLTEEARQLHLDAVRLDMKKKLALLGTDLDTLYRKKQYARILEAASLFLQQQFTQFYMDAGRLIGLTDREIYCIESSLIRSGYLIYADQLLEILKTKKPDLYKDLLHDRKLLAFQIKKKEASDQISPREIKNLMENYPDSNIALEHYIRALIGKGRIPKAEDWLDKAEKIYPYNPVYKTLRGDIFWQKQQKEEALRLYSSILSEDEESCQADRVLRDESIYHDKEEACLKEIGRKIRSMKYFQKILGLSLQKEDIEEDIKKAQAQREGLLASPETGAAVLGKLYELAGEPQWQARHHSRIETADTHEAYVEAKGKLFADSQSGGKNIAFPDYRKKQEFSKGDWVREIQKRALTLLNEVDEICVKYNIDHFIGPKTLAQANAYKGYTDQPHMVDMMIPAGRLRDFVDAVAREAREDRAVDYLGNNPSYPFYQLSYVDKNSVSFDPEIEKAFHYHGIRVEIIPVRNRPVLLSSWSARMLETGWENNHFKIEHEPNRNKAYAETAIKKLERIQPDKMAGFIFKTLERNYRYRENEEHLLKYPQKDWVNFFDVSFKKISVVAFDGYLFPAPSDVEGFLTMVTKASGIREVDKVNARREVLMNSVLTNEEDWMKGCEENDDCLNKLWSLQEEEYDIRKLLKERELRKNKIFLYARRSRDRMELYEELSGQDRIIDNLYREKDFESLGRIFRRSTRRTLYYLDKGLGLCVCKKYFDIQCELLELEGKEEKVKELRELIPARHMKALKAGE